MFISCSGSAFRGSLEDVFINTKKTGIDYVDLIAINGWDHINLSKVAENFEEEASKIESLLSKYQLTPVAINMALPHTYLRDEESVRQRNVEAEAAAKLMKRLDIGLASFYPGYKNEEMSRNRLLNNSVDSINEMLEIAKKYDVEFVIEPHYDTPYQTPSQIRELLHMVEDLYLAFDPSHFAMQDLSTSEIEFLFQRTRHLHVRDAKPGEMQSITGEGIVDFKWLLENIKAHGYDGPCTIEVLAGDKIDSLSEIKKLKEIITPYL